MEFYQEVYNEISKFSEHRSFAFANFSSQSKTFQIDNEKPMTFTENEKVFIEVNGM